MHTVNVTYVPSEWKLFGSTFDCQHLETHAEEAISTFWSEMHQDSIDEESIITVCNDCDETLLENGCEQ